MTERTIEITLPDRVTVLVYETTDPPGDWVIKAMINAVDVETGEPGSFTTTWRGGKPGDDDIAQTVINMLAHEVREQLGLDPHRTRRNVDGQAAAGAPSPA